MRTKILSATLENLGSYRRADYPLSDLGLAIVEGRNHDDPRAESNGSGKSTAYLDGPTWALFGDFRGDSDAVVNDQIGKGCAATVRLEVPGTGLVSVQRTRKAPGSGKSALRLWIGAAVADLADAQNHHKAEVSGLDARDTQRKIEDVLGLDLEVFGAAVYRSQRAEHRFASLTDSAQKALLSRVFGLDEIDGWREAASLRAKDLSAQLAAVKANDAGLLTRLELLSRQIDALKAAKTSFDLKRQHDLAQLSSTLDWSRQELESARQRQGQEASVLARIQWLQANPPVPPTPPTKPPEPAREALPPKPVVPYYRPEPVSSAQLSALVQRVTDAGWRVHQRAEELRAVHAALARLEARLASPACLECGAVLSADRAATERTRVQREIDAQAIAIGDAQKKLATAQFGLQSAQTAQEAAQAARAEWEGERQARDCALAQMTAWEASAREAAGRDQARREAWLRACAEIDRQHQADVVQVQGPWRQEIDSLMGLARAFRGAVDVQRLEASVSALTVQIAGLESAPCPVSKQIEDSDAEQAAVTQAAIDAKASRMELEQQLRHTEFWVEGFGPKGIKAMILDERVQALTDRTNHWLRVLTGGVWWVRLETQSQTKAGATREKFAVRVFRSLTSGQVAERQWEQWSGGQQARVGIAIDLAIADAVASRARRSFDLLVLDECFRHLDQGGRDTVLEALQELRKDRGSVVVVDHDPQFRAAFDRKVVVEYRGGFSSIREEVADE